MGAFCVQSKGASTVWTHASEKWKLAGCDFLFEAQGRAAPPAGNSFTSKGRWFERLCRKQRRHHVRLKDTTEPSCRPCSLRLPGGASPRGGKTVQVARKLSLQGGHLSTIHTEISRPRAAASGQTLICPPSPRIIFKWTCQILLWKRKKKSPPLRHTEMFLTRLVQLNCERRSFRRRPSQLAARRLRATTAHAWRQKMRRGKTLVCWTAQLKNNRWKNPTYFRCPPIFQTF